MIPNATPATQLSGALPLEVISTPLGVVGNEILPIDYKAPVKDKVESAVNKTKTSLLNINPQPINAQQSITPFEPVVITPAKNDNNLAASAGLTIGGNIASPAGQSNNVANITRPGNVALVISPSVPIDNTITAANKAMGANLVQPNQPSTVLSSILTPAQSAAIDANTQGLSAVLNRLPANNMGVLMSLSDSPLAPGGLLATTSTFKGATPLTSPTLTGQSNVGNFVGSVNLPDAQSAQYIGAPITQTQNNSLPVLGNNTFTYILIGIIALIIFLKHKKR